MLKGLVEKEPPRLFCVKLALAALLLRFCLASSYYNFFVLYLKRPLYAFDGEVYSIFGWYIALVLKGANIFMLPGSLVPNDFAVIGGFFGTIANFGGRLPPISQYGVGLYSYIIGILYYVFGYTPVLIRFFNSILSVLSAFLVYDIAKRSFSENVAKISFFIMLFNPSFILYSISLQRDTLVNFLILLVISQVLKSEKFGINRRSVAAIALFITGMALLYVIRMNSMAVLSVFILIFIYMMFASAYKRVAAYLALVIFLTPPLLDRIWSFIYSKWVLMIKFHWGLTFLGGYTFQLLPDRYYALGDAGEGWFSKGIAFHDLVTATIKGLIVFFTEPSLFTMHKITHLAALPQMILWYFIVLFALVGIYLSLKTPTILKTALIVVMSLFTFSLGISDANTETLIRHRDMIVPIYIIFAAKGIEVIGKRKEKA